MDIELGADMTDDRITRFETMWRATILEEVISFEEAWTVDHDIPRPTKRALKWGWSFTEQTLYDFFLGIFAFNHPQIKHGRLDALLYWPLDTAEAKMILQWLEEPFRF